MSEFLTQFMERRGELLELTIEHMEMTSLAVLASLIVGGLIGIAITKNDKAAAIVIGIANLMQSIPSIGLLAFMVPFVGIGQKPAIIMVVIYALLPIIKNTYTGITGIDPKLLEAASGIGLSKTQQLLRIQLPLARAVYYGWYPYFGSHCGGYRYHRCLCRRGRPGLDDQYGSQRQ